MNKQHDTTMTTETTGNIALRTVPVYIKMEIKNFKLMPFWMMQVLKLTSMLLNWGLQGCLQKVNVSVLNGRVYTL